MDTYAKEDGLMVEVACGEMYLLTSPFGIFEIEKLGYSAVWSFLWVGFFKKLDDKSLLFGVNWNGN
jgi:hypothetical protein